MGRARATTAPSSEELRRAISVMQRAGMWGGETAVEMVGLRNIIGGPKWIKPIGAKPDEYYALTPAGEEGCTGRVDRATWEMMRRQWVSVRMGYLVRDDSVLLPGDAPAPPDEDNPNAILDVEAFLDLSEEQIKGRIEHIETRAVIQRIRDAAKYRTPMQYNLIQAMDARLFLFDAGLPLDFDTLPIGELRSIAKEKEILIDDEDTVRVEDLRARIRTALRDRMGWHAE